MSTPKRTSPNGKQRLLSFLRGLLDDPTHSDIIIWTNHAEQEFQLLKPHKVAELWGATTGNPQMNYDKMSRGLRYFYTNHTLKKMPGKNSGYQFLDNTHQEFDFTKMIKSEPLANFNISNIIDPRNSLSPTSSASSAGSTSPIASLPDVFNPFALLIPDHLTQLTQNLIQFNAFIMKFPQFSCFPIPMQLQLFFNSKNLFPNLFSQ